MNAQKSIINLFLILAALWSLCWYGLAKYGEEQTLAYIQKMKQAGYIESFEYQNIEITGYPFHIRLDIIDPHVVVDSTKWGKALVAKVMNTYMGVDMFTHEMIGDDMIGNSKEDFQVLGTLSIQPNYLLSEFKIVREAPLHWRTEKGNQSYYLVKDSSAITEFHLNNSPALDKLKSFIESEDTTKKPYSITYFSNNDTGIRWLDGVTQKELSRTEKASIQIVFTSIEGDRQLTEIKMDTQGTKEGTEYSLILNEMLSATLGESVLEYINITSSKQKSSRFHGQLNTPATLKETINLSQPLKLEIFEHESETEHLTQHLSGLVEYGPPASEEDDYTVKVAFDTKLKIHEDFSEVLYDKISDSLIKSDIWEITEEKFKSILPPIELWSDIENHIAFKASVNFPVYVKLNDIAYRTQIGEYEFSADGDFDYYVGFDTANGNLNITATNYEKLLDSIGKYVNNAIEILVDEEPGEEARITPELLGDFKGFLKAISNTPDKEQADFNTSIYFGFADNANDLTVGTIKGKESVEDLYRKFVLKHNPALQANAENINPEVI